MSKKVLLFYPRADMKAEELSVRLAFELDNVDILPRFRSRNERLARRLVQNADAAIFLNLDPRAPIDDLTRKDLQTLYRNGKKLYVVLPRNRRIGRNLPNVEQIRFNPNDTHSLIRTLQEKIADLQPPIAAIERHPEKTSTEQDDTLKTLAAIFFVLAGLYLVSRK